MNEREAMNSRKTPETEILMTSAWKRICERICVFHLPFNDRKASQFWRRLGYSGTQENVRTHQANRDTGSLNHAKKHRQGALAKQKILGTNPQDSNGTGVTTTLLYAESTSDPQGLHRQQCNPNSCLIARIFISEPSRSFHSIITLILQTGRLRLGKVNQVHFSRLQ